jgi:hypothetical protein
MIHPETVAPRVTLELREPGVLGEVGIMVPPQRSAAIELLAHAEFRRKPAAPVGGHFSDSHFRGNGRRSILAMPSRP